MKIVYCNELLFKYLKKLDYHKFNREDNTIGLLSQDGSFLDEKDVQRIIDNHWPEYNNYYYVVRYINLTTIKNLLTITPIIKGIVLDFTEYNEKIPTICNYAISQKLKIFVNNKIANNIKLDENYTTFEVVYEI